MLPLLVWLAGIVFGLWLIWHWSLTREAMAFAVCASVMAWIVGGAAWIGQKLQAGAAARMASGSTPRQEGSATLRERPRDMREPPRSSRTNKRKRF